jgi:hypothetical protein
MAKPKLINNPSSKTALPRCSAEEHSLCQFGAVAVSMPSPNPEKRRPTMSCTSENDEHWMMAPAALIAAPNIIDRSRPQRPPINMQDRAALQLLLFRHPGMLLNAVNVTYNRRSNQAYIMPLRFPRLNTLSDSNFSQAYRKTHLHSGVFGFLFPRRLCCIQSGKRLDPAGKIEERSRTGIIVAKPECPVSM